MMGKEIIQKLVYLMAFALVVPNVAVTDSSYEQTLSEMKEHKCYDKWIDALMRDPNIKKGMDNLHRRIASQYKYVSWELQSKIANNRFIEFREFEDKRSRAFWDFQPDGCLVRVRWKDYLGRSNDKTVGYFIVDHPSMGGSVIRTQPPMPAMMMCTKMVNTECKEVKSPQESPHRGMLIRYRYGGPAQL